MKNSVSDTIVFLNDRQAFQQLFDEMYKSLCVFCSKIIQNDTIAEDLVQDLFVEILHHSQRKWNRMELCKYLYGSIKNRALDYLKHERVIRHHQDRLLEFMQSDINNEIIEEEVYRKIYKAIQHLSPQARAAVILHMNDNSNREIASKLQISVNTVKTVKARAYRSIRNFLGCFGSVLQVIF